MICFLLETRKNLLDHIVRMHDQYIIDITRRSRNAYEKKHRDLRKRQKRAVDTVLNVTAVLLDWEDDEPLTKTALWSQVNEESFRSSLDDLRVFKALEERGYGDILLKKYPSLRKYFASFAQLPFEAEHGSQPLLKGIDIARQLDAKQIKQIPPDAPTSFVPKELRRALTDKSGKINRNAWEMGLALAIKDALRSGDLYLPHELPLASLHGTGEMSSSDAQRFGIRASSLLASYYPRYYGYYRKAIGIYTHVSDQYAVFGTKVISCSPREALYVLDGLLENNSVLNIQKHTTDTGGYTEIIFALCYLLGYEFMPRIRDLKDQQLYKVNRGFDYGDFAPLLTKYADIDIVEEQWASMIRVAVSLIQRTAPAHIVVQRLINSYPSDRLSKAFTHLGRILKTQYILRYLTDASLRRSVQRQLNKGEYRHKLPRWIFFANQGQFLVGDYEEIMNKASCLSLVSNAILYWNTLKIDSIIQNLRHQGEEIDDETLSHSSLLPFKHVLPNGTYFIEDL